MFGKWLAQFFRIRITLERVPAVPVFGQAFNSELARRDAYERVFFGSESGLLVLKDILSENGVFAPSFPQTADPVAAALRDGYKGAALKIMHTAGGSERKLARAILLNDLGEARENDERYDD